jgi:hypothetical protein
MCAKYVYEHGPILEKCRTDENGVMWVEVPDFPDYEITDSTQCKHKTSVKCLSINRNLINFSTPNINHYQRISIDLVYRRAFRIFKGGNTLQSEEWMDVKCNSNYAVSSHGRILFKKHLNILQNKNENGYIISTFKCHCKTTENLLVRNHFVHILVTECFIGRRPSSQHTVNHINGIKDDNHFSNLEWASKSEQILHAVKTGLINKKRKHEEDVIFTNEEIDNEEWKIVPHNVFNDEINLHLEVSSLGRTRGQQGIHKLIKQNAKGYRQGTYSINNKVFRRLIHRLVALTFIPNPLKLTDVDHIDDDKGNNRVENLQWLSGLDNIQKANSKRVSKQNIETGETLETFESLKDAAKMTGVSMASISRCCIGERNHCNGFKWIYIDKNL